MYENQSQSTFFAVSSPNSIAPEKFNLGIEVAIRLHVKKMVHGKCGQGMIEYVIMAGLLISVFVALNPLNFRNILSERTETVVQHLRAPLP